MFRPYSMLEGNWKAPVSATMLRSSDDWKFTKTLAPVQPTIVSKSKVALKSQRVRVLARSRTPPSITDAVCRVKEPLKLTPRSSSFVRYPAQSPVRRGRVQKEITGGSA
jgi:hypothetical protein